VLDQLLAAVNLGEKLPDAVGWQFFGPYKLSLPEEVLEEVSENLGSIYTTAGLYIYNYSGSSKSEIRVLYSGSFKFKPLVSYGRRNVAVKWKHDEENNEFIFLNTPPNEQIEIELFNTFDNFSVDQVLVDGKLVTGFMNKRAIARAYPAPKWIKVSMIGLCIFAAAVVSTTGYTSYNIYKQREDSELLSGLPAGYSACIPYVFYNPPNDISKQTLRRKINKLQPWMSYLLAKNKVSFQEELYDLDRVVLCTPTSEETQ
jgi:hypothetical protein